MYTLYIWIWNLKRQHICLYCILLQRAEEIQSVCGDSSASWVWGRHRWRWWKCYQSHSALHLQVKDFSYLLSNFPLHTSSKTTTEKNKNRFFHYADVADIDFLQPSLQPLFQSNHFLNSGSVLYIFTLDFHCISFVLPDLYIPTSIFDCSLSYY